MAYNKTNWVDGQTPLSAQNLNKIENELGDQDSRITNIENGTTKVPKATQADSATKLQTARTINGVSFDGTANITIADGTKAPISHASSGTEYGVGTTSNYGHCKTINNLTQPSHVNGNALSAYQGKVLNDKFSPLLGLKPTLLQTINVTSDAFSTVLPTYDYDAFIFNVTGNISFDGSTGTAGRGGVYLVSPNTDSVGSAHENILAGVGGSDGLANVSLSNINSNIFVSITKNYSTVSSSASGIGVRRYNTDVYQPFKIITYSYRIPILSVNLTIKVYGINFFN